MSNDTKNMMANAHKGLIHNDLIRQIVQWAIASGKTELRVASLSGASYPFERKLHHELSILDIPSTFFCAEGLRKEYEEACANKPHFARLMLGAFSELLFDKYAIDPTTELLWTLNGHWLTGERRNQTYAKIVRPPNKDNFRSHGYNVVWADRCQSALEHIIDEDVAAMSFMEEGLYYTTNCLSVPYMEVEQAITILVGEMRCAAIMKQSTTKTEAFATAVQECFIKKLMATGVKFKPVYMVVYNGLDEATHMLTLGFEMGSPLVKWTCEENRTDQVREDKISRRNICYGEGGRRMFGPSPSFAKQWWNKHNMEVAEKTKPAPAKATAADSSIIALQKAIIPLRKAKMREVCEQLLQGKKLSYADIILGKVHNMLRIELAKRLPHIPIYSQSAFITHFRIQGWKPYGKKA